MLSVLIPVYNYNVVSLVSELHKQLLVANIEFEIRCLDDASTIEFVEINEAVGDLPKVTYSISKQNSGREITRQILAESALYSHLLFLDADTFPCESLFIQNYLSQLNTDVKAVFGGIMYKSERPKKSFILRWKYGIAKEVKSSSERNKARYRSITSPNFIIDKNTFIHYNSKIKQKDYGFDVYFAALLKEDNVAIQHIDNMIYHLGIEESDIYLSKSEFALRTYHSLLHEGKISKNDNSLLSLYTRLKRLKLHYVFGFLFKQFNGLFKRQLLGSNPSITLFQIYRLSYLCNYDIQQSSKNQLKAI